MKLIIDIPDEMYDWAINYNKFYQTYSKNDLLEVIQNGKPVIIEADKKLEGYNCDDCISRQAVLDKAVYTETEEGWSGMTVDVKDIEALPPVKPQEPKTGYWILEKWNNKEHYSCSRIEALEMYKRLINGLPGRRMRIDEFPNIDELVYKKIINEVPIIDEYANQEINKVLEEIKAEINYVGAHSDYGMQCVFAIAVAIIDKHKRKISKLNMEPTKYEFQLKEGDIDERQTEDQKTQA